MKKYINIFLFKSKVIHTYGRVILAPLSVFANFQFPLWFFSIGGFFDFANFKKIYKNRNNFFLETQMTIYEAKIINWQKNKNGNICLYISLMPNFCIEHEIESQKEKYEQTIGDISTR